MSTSTSSISSKEQTAPIMLLTFSSRKDFDQVITDFEKQLGRMDEGKLLATKDLPTSIKQMEGSSGLMIVHVLEMGRILPALADSPIKARQYLVGNPGI